jgi:hypothetical protein
VLRGSDGEILGSGGANLLSIRERSQPVSQLVANDYDGLQYVRPARHVVSTQGGKKEGKKAKTKLK